MKWSLQGTWMVGGFGLTLLLMGFVSFISYRNIIKLRESANKVQHTYEVLNNLTDFYANMTLAESGRRGYIFAGNKRELNRHLQGINWVKFDLDLLQKQMRYESFSQQQELAILNNLTIQRIEIFRQSIELYRQDTSAIESQALLTGKSIIIREKILTLLSKIKSEQEKTLKVWLDNSHSIIYQGIFLSVIGIFLGFIVIIGIYLMLYYQWIQRQKLESIQQSIAQEKELINLKMSLFSMVSHEFRTPLSIILASSQLLGEILQGKVDDGNLKNLYRIQASAKLINQLLTDILMLARAEAGTLEYKPELLDIESFCLNLVEDLQSFSSNKPSIKFNRKGQCNRVYLDEKLLYSILSNLLLNGIKYSPQGGNLDLTLICETEATIFEVKDEGMGIIFEDKQKIYDPFYRGQNVENIVGTGLGLSVVKKCVEMHQGKIQVESEVGLGTTFTVKIPLQKSRY